MDIAAAGHRAARERLAALAAVGEVRRGSGYVAVRTGLDSNDLNGVVAEPGFVPSAALVAELVAWLAGAPAQWLAAGADPALTEVLVAGGLVPERTGHWCGREVGRVGTHLPAAGVERVTALDEWSAVAQACGWGERPAYDLAQRPHWVALRAGVAVGVASAWLGEGSELVDVAVLPGARRTGVGTALVETVLAWAPTAEIVAAPSPDGWALLSTLGFESAPVTADVAFYLP